MIRNSEQWRPAPGKTSAIIEDTSEQNQSPLPFVQESFLTSHQGTPNSGQKIVGDLHVLAGDIQRCQVCFVSGNADFGHAK
jgi:hypothetical protein